MRCWKCHRVELWFEGAGESRPRRSRLQRQPTGRQSKRLHWWSAFMWFKWRIKSGGRDLHPPGEEEGSVPAGSSFYARSIWVCISKWAHLCPSYNPTMLGAATLSSVRLEWCIVLGSASIFKPWAWFIWNALQMRSAVISLKSGQTQRRRNGSD